MINRYIKKLYFVLFYNTNFLINLFGSFFIYIVVVIFNILFQVASINLINLYISIFLGSYAYIIVYLINDLIDFEEDIRDEVYKVNAFKYFSRNFVFIVILISQTLLISFLIKYISFDLATYYVFVLVIFSILSFYHSHTIVLKKYTIILERLVKYLAPSYLLLSFGNIYNFFNYLIPILLVIPLFIFDNNRLYFQKKLKVSSLKVLFGIYSLYYFFLFSFIIFNFNFKEIISFFVFFVFFSFIYFLIKSLARKIFLPFFENYPEPDINFKRKETLLIIVFDTIFIFTSIICCWL